MRPKSSRSKAVAIRLGLVLLAEVVWFSLVYPMVPATVTGFTIELASGIIVAAALWGAALGMWWLAAGDSYFLIRRIGAVALAISIGIAIFVFAYHFRGTLSANFRYLR